MDKYTKELIWSMIYNLTVLGVAAFLATNVSAWLILVVLVMQNPKEDKQ